MTTPDMFGSAPDKPRGKHYIAPRGYAAPPGTGPSGMTCGDCMHIRGRKYKKCEHPVRAFKNTFGPATDIRVRSPACSKFERSSPPHGARQE